MIMEPILCYFRIKFASHDTGWSGDIPLKECPKENVPWLVKGMYIFIVCGSSGFDDVMSSSQIFRML